MSKNKLVVHVINNLNRGGAETLLLTICEGVKKRDNRFSFLIILLENECSIGYLFEEKGIPYEVLPLKNRKFIHGVSVLTKRLKELKPDIVHSHLLRSDRIAPLGAFLAGVKKRYVTIHSMEPYTNRHDKMARLLAGIFAQKLIAVSESAKRFCVDQRFYPSKKIQVIYNAPGFTCATNIGDYYNRKIPQFITVGRLVEVKGQIYQVLAMREILNSGYGCKLQIVGEGPERNRLEFEIEKYDLQDYIELVGSVNNVEDYYKQADFFINSSIYEGFNMSYVEALSVGLPAIITDLPPHKEIMNHSKLPSKLPTDIPPERDKELAKAIITALQLTDEEYQLESKRSLDIASHFTHEKMIDQYMRLYSLL